MPEYTFEQDIIRVIGALAARLQDANPWDEVREPSALSRTQWRQERAQREKMENFSLEEAYKDAKQKLLQSLSQPDANEWRGILRKKKEKGFKSAEEFNQAIKAFREGLDDEQRGLFDDYMHVRSIFAGRREIEAPQAESDALRNDPEIMSMLQEEHGLSEKALPIHLTSFAFPRGIGKERAEAIVEVLAMMGFSEHPLFNVNTVVDQYSKDTLLLRLDGDKYKLSTTLGGDPKQVILEHLDEVKKSVHELCEWMRQGWVIKEQNGMLTMQNDCGGEYGHAASIVHILRNLEVDHKRKQGVRLPQGEELDLIDATSGVIGRNIMIKSTGQSFTDDDCMYATPPALAKAADDDICDVCVVKGRNAIQHLLVEQLGVPGIHLPPPARGQNP